MKFTKILFLVSTTLFASKVSSASQDSSLSRPMAINNFIVKENLLKNDKIAIIACDAADTPLENIRGTFQFSINGFKQALKFNDGVAIAPQQIDKSTFIYLRHENEEGAHGKLYYVIKKEHDLKPIKINWLLLVLIPLILIILATMFRKFILIAAALLIILYLFNTSNGLNIPTFFSTIFDGLKSIF